MVVLPGGFVSRSETNFLRKIGYFSRKRTFKSGILEQQIVCGIEMKIYLYELWRNIVVLPEHSFSDIL